MPQCIGLVTSKTGAALQDVIHIITRRWPMVKLLLAPVSVQGGWKRKRALWMASAAWMQTRARI